MDQREAIKIARRYISSIKRYYQIEKVMLFGSFADGTNHEDSDIDLAIVFESIDDILELQIKLMRMRTDDDLLIEPHPFSLENFHASNPVVHEILKNGIELDKYAAFH